jgi:hypothetical protein
LPMDYDVSLKGGQRRSCWSLFSEAPSLWGFLHPHSLFRSEWMKSSNQSKFWLIERGSFVAYYLLPHSGTVSSFINSIF